MPTQTGSIDFKSTKGLQSYASGQYATLSQIKGQFATCSTAAGTQAKAATIVPSDTGWALYTGATITVKFTTDNTHATPTLNVNSTGAKSIRDHTGAALSESAYKWAAGTAMSFTYDGTYWRMQDTLSQRVTTAETAIEQNAESIQISAKKAETIDGNMLYDVDVSSLTKVHGPANRYFSDSGNSSFMVCDIRAISDAPAAGIEYMAHWSVSDSTANKQRGLCFYNGNYIQFIAGQKYTLSCWVRCTSGKFLFLHNAYANAFPASSGARTIDSAEDSGWQFVTTTVTATTTKVDRVYFMARTLSDSLAFECDMCGFKMTVAAYATQAELKVANDAISSKVSTNDYNGNTIASIINQDATTVQIAASKVQIDGTAVFNAIKPSADAAYDANGAAATVQNNLDNLQVGGRNLLTDSADISECFDHISKVTSIVGGYADPDGGTNAYLITPNATTWYAGPASSRLLLTRLSVSYTFSIWLRADNATQCTLCCRYMNATPYSSTAHRKTVDVTTEWQRFYISAPLKQAQTVDSIWIGQVTTEPIYAFHPMVEMSSTPSDWSPAPEDQEASVNSARTWYAECPTAAATAAKVATITPATTAFKLEKGVSVSVKFTYANTVASPTLNVNGTGAIAIMRYGTTAPSTSAATSWQANSVNTLTYDGTYWRLNNWLNDNTTYNLGRNLHATSIKVLEAVASGLLMAGTASGYKKIAAGVSFSLSYPLLYASAAYTANTSYTNTYETWNSVTYSNTAAIQSGAANKTIYLKGTVSANTFTIDSTNVFTTTEPTSEDGRFYIPLGIMSSATVGNFATSNSLYAYIDGKFRQVTPTEVVATQTIYIQAAGGTGSVSGTTTWVESAAESASSDDSSVTPIWTTKRPTYRTQFPVTFVATQHKRLDGTVTCTTPCKDDTTTVIDGGHITTGTIDASVASITNINASNITSGQISADYIDATGLIISTSQVDGLKSKMDGYDDTLKNMADEAALRGKWVKVDEDGVEVGNGGNATRVDADSVDFLVGGNQVATAGVDGFAATHMSTPAIDIGEDWSITASGGIFSINYIGS